MRLLALLLLCLAALGRGDGGVAPVVEKEEGEQGEAVLAPAPEPSVHTVFSAECTPYFDWQSLALVRSHKLVGMPGPITRLLACDEERLKNYKYLDIVPTHVHPNFARLHFADLGDDYVPYNKPGSIKHWLENSNVTADIVFFIDADMLFLRPVTPSLVGVRPGRAVSAAYDYLVGVDDLDVVSRFLEEPHRALMRKVGGWTMMYTADMRAVAPHWLRYTEAVRTASFGSEIWHKMGDAYVTAEFPRPWISEMYGYVFGAAKAGVDHLVNREMMLYPNYVPDVTPPYILHYGLEIKIGPTYVFDKHFHVVMDHLACPMQLFEPPPDIPELMAQLYPSDREPGAPPRESERLKLAAFTVSSLNSALQEYGEGQGGCPVCPPGCEDADVTCASWGAAGECDSNPGFMRATCKRTCATCACAPAGQAAAAGEGATATLRGGAAAAGGGGRGRPAARGDKAELQGAGGTPPARLHARQHAASAVRDAEMAAKPDQGAPPPPSPPSPPSPSASPPPKRRSLPAAKVQHGGGDEAAIAHAQRSAATELSSEDAAALPLSGGVAAFAMAPVMLLPVVLIALVLRMYGRNSRRVLEEDGRYED